jgi:hypothetical protein
MHEAEAVRFVTGLELPVAPGKPIGKAGVFHTRCALRGGDAGFTPLPSHNRGELSVKER